MMESGEENWICCLGGVWCDCVFGFEVRSSIGISMHADLLEVGFRYVCRSWWAGMGYNNPSTNYKASAELI